MKLNRLICSVVIFMLPLHILFAQDSDYIFPIRPDQKNYLSGNMGELRSNHFHAGIDIKTGGVEGLPVYAAADGYVSRIKMSAWGYGNALYILHPSGETTVYAHLQKYSAAIQQYVREPQYERKTFEIELFPEKNKFPVKQGDVIGFSGNTGGSGGPHLHFEIRDRNQEVLNPLQYGFKEIVDNIPPEVQKVALITLGKDARINDRFGRFELDIVKSGNKYQFKKKVTAHGNIGIEILGYDRANGALNRNGIATMEVSLDEEVIFLQNIEKFSFAETRNILVLHNYSTYKKTGKRFYKLYLDEGNQLPFYEKLINKGIIKVKDQKTHHITVRFWDSYKNLSSLSFELAHKPPASKVVSSRTEEDMSNTSEVLGNTLKITSLKGNVDAIPAIVYANRMIYTQKPAYAAEKNAVYLWDLSRGLPDSVSIGSETWQYNYKAIVPSGRSFNLYTPNANITFQKQSLYDTLYLQTSYWQDLEKEVFSISEDLYPINKFISVTLKPRLDYPDKERTHVYSINSYGGHNFVGGVWQNDYIKFNTRNFGEYTILIDTLGPAIKPFNLTKEEVSFIISDERSGIRNYETLVNGEWLLMHYDYKRRLIWSDRLTKEKPLSGELILRVTDQAGNESVYKTKL